MNLDPLSESHALQEAASAKGFDWPDVSGVLDKVAEELEEIRDALREGDPAHARCELGDLLMATVNLSRFLDADPGEELHKAGARFGERFALLEEELEEESIEMKSCTLEFLDARWAKVKRKLDPK
jgi:ATP diphosphatase